MEEIISKLKTILDNIEELDDPTMDESIRKHIGLAHYHTEEALSNLKNIRP